MRRWQSPKRKCMPRPQAYAVDVDPQVSRRTRGAVVEEVAGVGDNRGGQRGCLHAKQRANNDGDERCQLEDFIFFFKDLFLLLLFCCNSIKQLVMGMLRQVRW